MKKPVEKIEEYFIKKFGVKDYEAIGHALYIINIIIEYMPSVEEIRSLLKKQYEIKQYSFTNLAKAIRERIEI
jgi:hypothetical protein